MLKSEACQNTPNDPVTYSQNVLLISVRTLSSKVRAPPPPKKLLTCNPEDVRINESDIPNYFTSSHRRGLLRQSQENAKEPQALTMKPLSDGVGSDMDTSASQKGNDNLKALIRSDEKLLKIFYGMFYINEHSGKDWKLRVDGFIPVCLLQTLGNVNKPFKIIALQGSARVSVEVHILWNLKMSIEAWGYGWPSLLVCEI